MRKELNWVGSWRKELEEDGSNIRRSWRLNIGGQEDEVI
jgi:hypothetical protein